MGGSVEKQIQKAVGSLLPCGNRCRFSESAICSSRVHPPSEIKSNFKFKTLKWRLLRWLLTLSDQNPSEPDSDKEISLKRASRRLLCWLGSQLGIHRKLGLWPLATIHETVLGHLLKIVRMLGRVGCNPGVCSVWRSRAVWTVLEGFLPTPMTADMLGIHLFYLPFRSIYLWSVFFTYGGGGEEPQAKKTNSNFWTGGNRS